jgi:hypothetical protein
MRLKTQNYVHRSGVESAHGSRDKRVLNLYTNRVYKKRV